MVQQGSAPRSRLRLEIAQASDPGKDPNKQVNEDSCGYVETKHGHLAVLCDGMGGHYGGQEASRLAIKTIFEEVERSSTAMKPVEALKHAVERAALRVYELGGPPDNKARPGSTVVAMLLHDGGVDVAHVGDSRAYVIRSSQIYPLTRDHSMVQGLIDAGQLTEEQAIGHPDANKITRALGMKPEVDVEVRPEPMELFAGDLLLQASDGLTDLALSRDILRATLQALASGGIEHACKQLVQLANDRGGHDNITVQIARIAETGPSRTAIPGSTAPPSSSEAPTEALPRTPNPLAGAPVPPTASGVSDGGVGPTILGGPILTAPDPGETDSAGPQSGPVWASGMFARPGDPPQPGLASYDLDSGAQALPRPPPAPHVAPTLVQGPTSGTAGRAGPTVNEAYAVAPYGSHFAAPQATPVPFSYGGASSAYGNEPVPSRGGIVFLITGVSIVLAILILVALWAAGLLD
jgi:PPM family protein phosphatase